MMMRPQGDVLYCLEPQSLRRARPTHDPVSRGPQATQETAPNRTTAAGLCCPPWCGPETSPRTLVAHTGDRAVGPRALVSKNIIWLYRLGPR